MSISIDDIKNLEHLARLKLTDENRQELLSEVGSIVDYVGQIDDLDLGAIDNSTLVHSHKNVTRVDQISSSDQGTLSLLLSNTPEQQDNFIKVKQVIKK